MPRLLYITPLAVFAAVLAGLAVRPTNDPRRMPSPLIDKPTPAFAGALTDVVWRDVFGPLSAAPRSTQ